MKSTKTVKTVQSVKKKMRRKVFAVAGYNTVSFGSGRKEFSPKKAMPNFLAYLKESVEGTLAQVKHRVVDEGVISNFMAARFIRQGNLAGFLPTVCPELKFKPCTRVEGACGSGGLGLTTGIKAVLSEQADTVLVAGFEIQNTQKALYGADVLAAAGYYEGERKNGHAFFFPGIFSDRAGAYYEKYGRDATRKAMAAWYAQAVTNARLNPKAQEHHNTVKDLVAQGMTPPNAEAFLAHLNVFDCSKVSDGASSVIIASEKGLKALGVPPSQAVQITGFGQCEDDITVHPEDKTTLFTTAAAAKGAMAMAGIGTDDVGLLELHDCFTITALLALESVGFAPPGKGGDLVLGGATSREGRLPTNTSGGLVGFGHYTGGTGVRQLVDMLHQFTGAAGGWQVKLAKEHGLSVNMGGNDKTVVSLVVKPA